MSPDGCGRCLRIRGEMRLGTPDVTHVGHLRLGRLCRATPECSRHQVEDAGPVCLCRRLGGCRLRRRWCLGKEATWCRLPRDGRRRWLVLHRGLNDFRLIGIVLVGVGHRGRLVRHARLVGMERLADHGRLRGRHSRDALNGGSRPDLLWRRTADAGDCDQPGTDHRRLCRSIRRRVDAGCHDGDADASGKAVIDRGAEDDVGVLGDFLAYAVRRLIHFEQRHVVAAGDVDQQAACTPPCSYPRAGDC